MPSALLIRVTMLLVVTILVLTACASTNAPLRDAPQINHPDDVSCLQALIAWRKSYGLNRLAQIAVHRDCPDA